MNENKVEITTSPTSVGVNTYTESVNVNTEITYVEVPEYDVMVEVQTSSPIVTIDTSEIFLEVDSYTNILDIQTSSIEVVSIGIQGPEGSPGTSADALYIILMKPLVVTEQLK